MSRKDLILELKKYFKITELVCNHTFEKFGETSWQFFDYQLLETLLVLRRDIFKAPMLINHGEKTQRGLRCNVCQLVKDKTAKNEIYLSSHANGAGIDFDVTGLTAEQARQKIISKRILLPHKIRLENDITWVHLDIYDSGIGEKVSTFKG